MTSSDSFMKLYNPNTVLLNHRVLIPIQWIQVPKDYALTPLTTVQYNRYLSVVSDSLFERLAASTALHCILLAGDVILTDIGCNRLNDIWLESLNLSINPNS